MNSFIYEGSAFEEKVGKYFFESENWVISKIGSNARKGKNISYFSLQKLGIKNIWEFIKEINELAKYFSDFEIGEYPERAYM